MKQVPISAKQAQLLVAAQNKAQQLALLTQEANLQVQALLEIIAEVAGIPVNLIVSVDPTTNALSVQEAAAPEKEA